VTTKRPRATVVCEPFAITDAQAEAYTDVVTKSVTAQLIRERDEREKSEQEAAS